MTPGMNPRFILDENVVILAQQGQDEFGNTDPVYADLILQIIQICHTIVVDDILWDKYYRQLYSPGYRHPDLGPFLINLLRNTLSIHGKVDGIGHAAPILDDEGSIPSGSQDDTFLVRIAAETGAILVTTDGALRDDLASCGFMEKYDLKVVSPGQAFSLL